MQMRIFGRNRGQKQWVKQQYPIDPYKVESEKVLASVTHLEELGAYEHWAPYTSIFQQVAFEGPYGDIVSILARIESKAMFDERN